MARLQAGSRLGQPGGGSKRVLALSAFVLVGVAVFFSAGIAFAGQASTGQLFFYPCTTCHPVTLDSAGKPVGRLPNGFQGHQIVLVGHDVLGRTRSQACLTCHDDPTRNPGMLKTANGSLIPITGDISLVCFRCHESKYEEWKAGTHGKHKPNCDAAGCHDPHSPRWIYAAAQKPFLGSGWQFQILPARQAFAPLAAPAPPPAVAIPTWFFGVALVGLVVAGGLGVRLLSGRRNR